MVMPKSRRCARAWLERPARVSKPAPQKSQRIRLKVPGSKFATAEGWGGDGVGWDGVGSGSKEKREYRAAWWELRRGRLYP